MKSIFSNNLKSLRTDNDYGQKEIADAIGISRSRYSNYENGISEPNVDVLIKLSDFFNCSIDDLLKNKLNTTTLSKPKLSVTLDEFSYSKLKEELLKNKYFYEEKRKTILNEIDTKISEIDSLLDFINNKYKDEFASDISPNIIKFKSKKEKKDYRKINLIGIVSAGSPSYAYEEIIESFDIPSTLLSPSKDYFILKIKGDSMNKLFEPGELILVERTSSVVNEDIVIAIIGEEATCKKVDIQKNEIVLIPQSTNSLHKNQIYNHVDVNILGKVIGKLSNFIDIKNE